MAKKLPDILFSELDGVAFSHACEFCNSFAWNKKRKKLLKIPLIRFDWWECKIYFSIIILMMIHFNPDQMKCIGCAITAWNRVFRRYFDGTLSLTFQNIQINHIMNNEHAPQKYLFHSKYKFFPFFFVWISTYYLNAYGIQMSTALFLPNFWYLFCQL